jgi:putative endopeptidase
MKPNRIAVLLVLLVGPAGVEAQTRSGDPVIRSGVDQSTFDSAVRPQDDLFRHVNGNWLAKTEIPADHSVFGSFLMLRDRSEAAVRKIAEDLAAQANEPPGSEARKIGDLYAGFLDEARVESLGLKPVEADLARIDAIGTKPEFLQVLAALQREGATGLFRAEVIVDAKHSDRYVVVLTQGGIELPDESYYREPKFQPIRDRYANHLEKIFALAGTPGPKSVAESVMSIETSLAKHHWDRVKSRDRTLTYNKMKREVLEDLTPGFDWGRWFAAYGAGDISEVVVAQPDFFKAIAPLLDQIPLDRWKDWLKWHVLKEAAPLLSKPFAEADFHFFDQTLTGALEIRPRWKRGVAVVEKALGEAVGKLYVSQHFPPTAKARMQELVANLIEAYREDITDLEWMSPETRKRALDKLAKFTPKIGYPDEWRDYSKLEISRGDLVGNVRRAAAFEVARRLAKLGKPVDRKEWRMTPQTVNAYYNANMNEIVFPAAILQPPFFDMAVDDAVNYGGIGAVIGHEIGHGFDDQGSKFDGVGNMVNWWTDADRKEFEARAKKLIEQYNHYEPAQLPGQKVKGALTIGENIGDLGGLTIAYKAYRRSLKGSEAPIIDGFTGDQRLFIGWAQVWRSKARDAHLTRMLATDAHSPPEFRCNGVVCNLPEFYAAFGLKSGDKLWLPAERRVRIW